MFVAVGLKEKAITLRAFHEMQDPTASFHSGRFTIELHVGLADKLMDRFADRQRQVRIVIIGIALHQRPNAFVSWREQQVRLKKRTKFGAFAFGKATAFLRRLQQWLNSHFMWCCVDVPSHSRGFAFHYRRQLIETAVNGQFGLSDSLKHGEDL